MGAPTVVSGLRLRPYAGESDLADMVRIGNADAEADGIDRRTDVGELSAAFDRPSDHFDPSRDVTIAEVDGLVVGYQDRNWVDTTDGLREYRIDGGVDPAWRRRGIGGTLLADGEARVRDATDHLLCDPMRRRGLSTAAAGAFRTTP